MDIATQGNNALVEEFRAVGAPLDVLHLDEQRVSSVYGATVFLLRPDLHIVWRGDGPPPDPAGLAALATGHATRIWSGCPGSQSVRSMTTV
jgi:hypothetical protein